MRRILVFAFLATLGLGWIGLAAPKISVDQAVYDFGEVVAGIAVTHTFVLTNVGDAALTITRVRTSCGCTTTALTKTTLAPGESVELTATFDTTHYSGKVGKSVYVESNDPHTPKLVLVLTGTVKRGEPYNISVADLNYLFYILIDLRSPDDYAAAHLFGAINIPYDQLSGWYNRLPKGILIVLYDQDGSLSDKAAQEMIAAGFPQAKSLLGGLNEWMRLYKARFVLTAE